MLSNEFSSQYTSKMMSAGPSPQTPLGNLKSTLQAPAGFKGGGVQQDGDEGERTR